MKKMALAMLTIAALSVSSFAGVIRIGAGAAPTENILKKVAAPFETKTGIKLVIAQNGPEAALKDLEKGNLDLACGGVSFADWMQMMAKDGNPVKDQAALKSRVIGNDVINVITSKDVTVSKLSKDQLKGIFTGAITNWKAVGGPDKPIIVVLSEQTPGTNTVFQKQIMDGKPYTTSVATATNAADIKKQVISKSGAVGLAPKSIVDNSVGSPDMPEVGRPITVITKGAPSEDVTKLLDFIKGEGQQYIKK